MKKQEEEDYGLGLQESFDRWEYLFKHGGSDPFWSDGVNLNLVRNHIFYYRNKLEENPTLLGFPAAYYKEIPPEVNSEYMARPDEIRKNARMSLSKYKTDPNYLYILQNYNDFSSKTLAKLSLDNVIGYTKGLEQYIKDDKLVDMRRHERYESYLQSFEDCVRRMQQTPSEEVQLSMFSSINCLNDESIEDDFDDYTNEEYVELEIDDEPQM